MILIILAWLYYFLISYFLGFGIVTLLERFIKCQNTNGQNFFSFWVGYIFLLGCLQILSLWLPMGTTVFLVILIGSAVSAIVFYRGLHKRFITLISLLRTGSGLIGLLGILLLLLVVSYSANREVEHADTFIYHFNAVKWAKEYAAVPGLANLHGRLGFNSSFFLFAAFTEIGVYSNQSAHIALSFLMVVCLIQFSIIIFKKGESVERKIFCMLTYPYLLSHIFWKIDINSLSTDYPTAVLLLIFCILLLDRFPLRVVILLPLSALVMAFKLSGLMVVFAAAIISTAFAAKLIFERKSKMVTRRILTVSAIGFAFILLPFLIRNAIISGWVIYPFEYGNLNLPWSVPKEYVVDMIAWIKSYPKIPGGASPQTIGENGFMFWFAPWYSNFKGTTEFILLAVSLLLIFFVHIQHASSRFVYPRLNQFAILWLAMGCIVFWFLSAPDIRFGSIYFYILFGISAVLFLETTCLKSSLVITYVIFFALVARNAVSFVIDRDPKLFSFTYTEPLELVRVVASPAGEDPPLYVYMPKEGDACGNSPLPCTPYSGGRLHENRGVSQRLPGDISKGFLPLP